MLLKLRIILAILTVYCKRSVFLDIYVKEDMCEMPIRGYFHLNDFRAMVLVLKIRLFTSGFRGND